MKISTSYYHVKPPKAIPVILVKGKVPFFPSWAVSNTNRGLEQELLSINIEVNGLK